MKKSSGKVVRYNKWGYIFLIPFIVVYVIFQLIPLVSTFYNSFFENYMSGLTQVGPKFVGLANYQKLFSDGDIWVYTKNTMVLWIMCFVPQIILSLVLGAWFSDVRLKLKGTRFFKTVVYLPEYLRRSCPIDLCCLKQRGIDTHHACHQKDRRITKPHQTGKRHFLS